MIRWALTAVAIVGIAAIVLVQLDGAAELVVWEVVLVVAVVVVAWRRWPAPPAPAGGMTILAPRPPARRPHSLVSIELEVSGAVDPALAGAQRLRRRLGDLVEHRVGAAPPPGVVDGELREILETRRDVLTVEEVEAAVDRLERS